MRVHAHWKNANILVARKPFLNSGVERDMSKEVLHIKNMVCPRCIASVQGLLEEMKLPVQAVQLGELELNEELSSSSRKELSDRLGALGFELLMDQKSKNIAKIKSLVIEQVHHKKEPLRVNFSTLLSEALNQEYSALSRLFSSVEGITIEKYVLKQKVERVKELLFYQELILSEIAHLMHYSSTAHLSAQFKKETGMTPSQFKSLQKPDRQALDAI